MRKNGILLMNGEVYSNIVKNIEEGLIMCRKLRELNGLSAEKLIERYGLDEQIPVDINGLLMKLDIPTIATDFSNIENLPEIREQVAIKGDILGAVVVDQDRIAIFYRGSDTLNRQKFTVTHELAHCCLNGSSLKDGHIEYRHDNRNSDDKKEIAANTFAGKILIPETRVREIHKKLLVPTVKDLADIFKVSEAVMRARLDDLKLEYFISSDEISAMSEAIPN